MADNRYNSLRDKIEKRPTARRKKVEEVKKDENTFLSEIFPLVVIGVILISFGIFYFLFNTYKEVLKVDNDFVHIEIRNNSVLTAFEEERITEKVNKAKQFNSLEEVFTSVLDATEGAGLGIIIIILMLQKVGLSKDNYKVYTTQDETVTSIMLPVNQQFNSEVTDLLVKFVSMQEKFPVLESNFSAIKKVFASPQININDLVGCFSKDLFLTSYLLNKASAKQQNICSIVQAINVIGLENLRIQFEKDKNLFFFFHKNHRKGRYKISLLLSI